jgi:hypothetical protein
MQVREEQLVKALTEMEALAKGGDKMPKNTAEANGALSTVGDKTEMATSDDVSEDVKKLGKAVKGKKLGKWAKEDESSDSEDSTSTSDDETSTAKKAMNKDEDESSSESKSDDESSSEETTSKGTIADLMKSDSQAGSVIDVSPFIERLVDQVSEAEFDLRKSLVEFQGEQETHNKAIRKSIVAMGNMLLEINNRLQGIENSPASARKTMLSKSEVMDRFEEETPDFSKAQILDAMVDLAQRGQIQPWDVTTYESTNHMEPKVLKSVENYLRKSA